jgi:hypothetical protein
MPSGGIDRVEVGLNLGVLSIKSSDRQGARRSTMVTIAPWTVISLRTW